MFSAMCKIGGREKPLVPSARTGDAVFRFSVLQKVSYAGINITEERSAHCALSRALLVAPKHPGLAVADLSRFTAGLDIVATDTAYGFAMALMQQFSFRECVYTPRDTLKETQYMMSLAHRRIFCIAALHPGKTRDV